tara:strand:+ start:2222 stop:2536 length:315 start_codon:yes stop_codon:yes gene_type:complete
MSGSTYKQVCPNCHGPLRVRNSIALHPLLRTIFFQCQNVPCGATYNGQMEITHILSPSGMPNASIDLPLAPSAIRKQAQHNNDDQQLDFDQLLNDETQKVGVPS